MFTKKVKVAVIAALALLCGTLLGVSPAMARPAAGLNPQQVVQLTQWASMIGNQSDLAVAIKYATGRYSVETLARLLRPGPSADRFFNRPAYVGGAPGTILDSRDVSRSATLSTGVAVDATQYVFVTRDSFGNPDVATATLLFRKGHPSKHIYVSSDATDSLGRDCSPGAKLASGRGFAQEYDPAWALRRGYGLLVPDHDGVDVRYAATRLTGHIVLDSMRLATRLHPTADFIESGYSGGGLAGYGASMLQNGYAPELNGKVKLYLAGGTPVDLSVLPATMSGSFIGSGILLAAIMGVSREYHQLYAQFNPLGIAVAYLMRNSCLQDFGILGATRVKLDLFAKPGAMQSAAARQVFAHTMLVGRGLRVPADLVVFHSRQDPWLPYTKAKAWCDEQATCTMLSGVGPHMGYGQSMLVKGGPIEKIVAHTWPSAG